MTRTTKLLCGWKRVLKSLEIAIAFVLFLPLALAQALPPAMTGSYRISGQVTNATSGEPVRGASVTALTRDNEHAVRIEQTDAEGRFSMDGLPTGKYPLTAWKRGYRTGFYDEHDGFNTAIVTGEGQDTTHLMFQLTPEAILSGVVTSDGGDPVEHANVMLFRRQDSATPGQRTVHVGNAATDDTGAYEFGDLAPGEYLVAVQAAPWYAQHDPADTADANARALDVAYPITFFESTTDEGSASSVRLAGGSHEEADITLHAVPALHFILASPARQGSAGVGADLRPLVFGTQVFWQGGGALNARKGLIEATGVAPGHYELTQGDPPRVVDLDATSDLEVDPNAGTPTLTLSGTLRAMDGSAVTEEVVAVLEPVNGGPTQIEQQAPAPRGRFRFDRVVPGTWALSAFNHAGQTLPVLAVAAGGTASAGNQVVVRDRAMEISVTVSRGRTQVQGFARKDGKAASGAMVVLVPREPGAYRALVRRDQTDSDGSFSLPDVPPGLYTVVVIQDGWKLDWQQREAIARYLPGGVPVTVSDRSGPIVSLSRPVPVSMP